MVKQVQPNKSTEEQIRDEHSHFSNSRRVIDGPLMIADKADGLRSLEPIHTALAAATNKEITSLKFEKYYRMISDVDCYISFAKATGGASIVGDTYVPAKTPVTIRLSAPFKFLNVISPSVGFVQLTELKELSERSDA